MKEFECKEISYKKIQEINEGTIIEIEKKEYRRCDTIYYSSVLKYRLFGIFFRNDFHILKQFMSCTNCFEKIDSYTNCINCNIVFDTVDLPFFLNSIYFTDRLKYNEYKILYNLNNLEESYRDQRHCLNNPFKQEIYEKALHPDKIKRILDLTDDLENLDDYI